MKEKVYSCEGFIKYVTQKNKVKKVRCTVCLYTDELSIIGDFEKSDNIICKNINDFRTIATTTGNEKFGILNRDFIDIIIDKKTSQRIYFKEKKINLSFANAIRKKIDLIKREDDINHKNDIYLIASNLADKDTIANLEAAIEKFQLILEWKDSKERINVCEERIKQQKIEIETDEIYRNAIALAKKNNLEDLDKAVKKFQSILCWKDSKDKVAECKKRIIEMKNDNLYQQAIKLSSANTIADLEEAIEIFQSIFDWKDSKGKINQCKNRISKIRNDEIYSQAINLASKNTIADLEEATKKFQSIFDWKDSKEKINECKKQIEKIKKDSYDNAILLAESKTRKITSLNVKKAITLLNGILPYADAEDLIKVYEKKVLNLQEEEFWNSVEEERKSYLDAEEDFSKYDKTISEHKNTVLSLVIQNPYYILGLPCSASNSEILSVKDKVEKYTRLKMANAYKTTYDLKNIEKPNRDISNIQTSIIAAKDIRYKWLWFSNNEYCTWWESVKLFEVIKKNGLDKFDYNLFLACYINLLLTDTSFSKSKYWNVLIPLINQLLTLSDPQKISILEEHIGSKIEDVKGAIESFDDTIITPIIMLCEKIDVSQMKKFLKLRLFTSEKAHNKLCDAVIKNITFKCYPLDNFIELLQEVPTASDLKNLMALVKETDEIVYDILPDIIAFVGKKTPYGKRIIKKYRDTFWNATANLSCNNKKAQATPYAKKIYKYCEEKEKVILRNVYGYKEMGASEGDLTPEELNDLAIEYSKKGNKNKMIALFTKAAEGGDRNAQHNLGKIYLNGEDAPKDLYLAEKWLLKASNQGDNNAMGLLVVLYADKNDGENTKKWLIKAAVSGNEAAFNIAKDWMSKGQITQYDLNRYGN